MSNTKKDKFGRLEPLGQNLHSALGRFAEGCRNHISDVGIGWKVHWKKYIVQSIAATIVIFIIFFAVTPERPS